MSQAGPLDVKTFPLEDLIFQADSGTAMPIGEIIELLGDSSQGLSTSASGNTVTFTNADATTTQKGVSELSTDAETITGSDSTTNVTPESLKAKLGDQTTWGVAYGQSQTSAIGWTAQPTDGQLIIGSTGAPPAAASLTSSDASITITPGSNSLDLTTGGAVTLQFDADSGSATPSGGIITMSGGTLLTSSASGSTVTYDADDNVVGTVNTDSGAVTPSSNAFTIAGGTLLNTGGSGSTATVNADDNVVGSVAADSGTATPTSNSFTISGSGSASTSASGSTVTVSVPSGGISWSVETGTTHSISASEGVFCNNAGGVTVTLPSSASVGDTFEVVAMDAAGFTIDYGTGQSIQVGTMASTVTSGTISSTDIGDWIQIVCNVTDTDFFANIKQGNVTVT